jgi:quercetin dioxygenase-like cupin family protein
MYVTSNAAIESATLPGLSHQTLAGSASGLTRLSIWRQSIEPGAATPPHRHDCDEVVVVESGRGELHVRGEVHPFGPDTTISIPANIDHQIFNTGADTIRLLAALSMTPVRVELPDGQPFPLPWQS